MNEDDVKLEVADDPPLKVDDAGEETEYAVAPDTAKRGAVESDHASAFTMSSNAPRTSPPNRAATNSPRRKTPAWAKNPTAALAAAIIVGGLAAVVVGKLVLWMLEPSAKPKRFGAVPVSRWAPAHGFRSSTPPAETAG